VIEPPSTCKRSCSPIIRGVPVDEKKCAPDDDDDRSNSTPIPTRLSSRVLGLDVGSRRIGIAVSDLLGITAQGLETLQRKNKRHDFDYLARVIREYEVKEIVVGLPLRMSGAEGTQSEKMRAFAADLQKRFGLPIHLFDERLTSAEANRFLRETELSIEKRGKAVDRMAAVLILQAWMESRKLNTGSE
jgi:putative Holliday junction resolvase